MQVIVLEPRAKLVLAPEELKLLVVIFWLLVFKDPAVKFILLLLELKVSCKVQPPPTPLKVTPPANIFPAKEIVCPVEVAEKVTIVA